MKRLDVIRSLIIAVLGALIVAYVGIRLGPAAIPVAILVVAILWAGFEVLISGTRLRIVWPSQRTTEEASDYGTQLAALMGMPLDDAPLVRARVAIMFAPFELSNTQRSVLVRWATFALAGDELDYEVEAVPGFPGVLWAVRCHANRAPQALVGVIESREAHRIVDAHRAMVARLLEERRPRRIQ